jgi:hypothetical protein
MRLDHTEEWPFGEMRTGTEALLRMRDLPVVAGTRQRDGCPAPGAARGVRRPTDRNQMINLLERLVEVA